MTDTLPREGELWLMTSSDDGHAYEALCVAANHAAGVSVMEHDACTSKVFDPSGVLLEERSALPPRGSGGVIWLWHRAPEQYRALSPHGGDEDWVAWVDGRAPGAPADGYDALPAWLTRSYARSQVTSHRVPGGTVFIGAHA